MRSENKVDSLNFSLIRMPLHLCQFFRTVTCELEFKWETLPINIFITFDPRELPDVESKVDL